MYVVLDAANGLCKKIRNDDIESLLYEHD